VNGQQRTTLTCICPVNEPRALCVPQRTVSNDHRTIATIAHAHRDRPRRRYHWTPKLLVGFVNTPVARDADVVLHLAARRGLARGRVRVGCSRARARDCRTASVRG
jgi:hypothetical protein